MNTIQQNNDRQIRRKTQADIGAMAYGMVPPQAVEVEMAVLGACMVDKEAFDRVMEILQPECFYVDAHQKIFKSFLSLKQKASAIDMLTVIEELKSKEELDIVGGPYAVSKLTNNVIMGTHVLDHSRIVFEKFMRREAIRIGAEIINDGYRESEDVFDMLDSVEHKLSSLATARVIKPYKTIQSLAINAVDRIYEVMHSKQELTGVPCGISQLDLITQGWQPTNLIVLAARPAVGKSAVAANFALNAALDPVKPTAVGIFSLEMPGIQWAIRMMSAETRIEMWDLKRGRISEEQMKSVENVAYQKFSNARIFLDDTSGLDLFQLKSKARMMAIKEGVGLIIIDYLQLMDGSKYSGNREQEISKISRELKQLAKELNIPVIALSQLSRAGDGKEPMLSHLRESGAIEQDADDVFFLIPVDDEMVAQDASLKDSILLKIAKHRNGVLEKVPIKFAKEIQKLMSESEYDSYMLSKNNFPSVPPAPGNWKRIEPIKEEIPGGYAAEYNDKLPDDLEDLPF